MTAVIIEILSQGPIEALVTSSNSFFMSQSTAQTYSPFGIDLMSLGTVQSGANLTITRAGDLLAKVLLKFTLKPCDGTNKLAATKTATVNTTDSPASATDPVTFTSDESLASRYCRFLPCHLIEEAKFIVASSQVDILKPQHIQAYHEIMRPEGKQQRATMMNGTADERTNWSRKTNADGKVVCWLSLPFFFAVRASEAYSLISSQFHQASLNIKLVASHARACVENETKTVAGAAQAGTFDAQMSCEAFCMFVYLSDQERQARVQQSSTVVIHQHQHTSFSVAGSEATKSQQLAFNFPVCHIMVMAQQDADVTAGRLGNYRGIEISDTASGFHGEGIHEHLITSIDFQINGNSRWKEDAHFFTEVMQAEYAARVAGDENHIYLLPFSVSNSYEDGASGSLNLSRVSTCTLGLTCPVANRGSAAMTVHVIALNLNGASYASGMFAVQYSS